ncbi:MAG: dephospho-CoA kinase [Phycisphaeraceae bacterium]
MHATADPHARPAAPTRKPVIGLLGAPGSGKSFVARLFEREGAAVIDADRLARETLDEPAVREQVRQWWGPGVLDADGRIDRKALGAIVFDNPEALHQLESLVHPRVHERRQALREQHGADPAVRAIVEDSPLLLEQGVDAECDVLVFVDASRAVREQRVRETRGWSSAELDRREKNQASLDMKRNRADYVLDNGVGEPLVREQARHALSQILQRIEPA